MTAPVLARPVRKLPTVPGVKFYEKGERYEVEPITGRRARVVFSL
ncbi:hypothetical protein [Rhodococcoides fascians]|nr:hypothetical protein [Rhodococcus fascians]